MSIADVPSVTFDVVCKGLAKFGDISYSIAFVCTTPAEKTTANVLSFLTLQGGTYTCCSVQFYSQSVTIRSKKKTISMPRDSPVSTFYKVQPVLNLPRKETRLQRGMYVHKEGGVQCRPCHRSFPVKNNGTNNAEHILSVFDFEG